MFSPTTRLAGTLHIAVAFDWGDEVDLAHAQRLASAREYPLVRRPRTPASIAFRPPPLRFNLPAARLLLPPLATADATVEATVFDFAAASVALRVPFEAQADELRQLAGRLSNSESLVQAARQAMEPLYRQIQGAIHHARWSEMSEEYFVFQFPPGGPLPAPAELLREAPDWLASLVRLESDPLSSEEVAESLRLRISYSPRDLVIPEWSAAVLIDQDCEESLQTMEFANLQLLEFRHTDDRLDDELARVYSLIHALARTWLPLWRTQSRPLRVLGDLKVEAATVFERTSNVLKLVGDQYLSRLYRLLSARFHLDEWAQSIQRTLGVVEGVYQVLSDQASTARTEILEVIIILLILWELVLAWVR